jgi:ADP-heptose:LPS heptosyltransferase
LFARIKRIVKNICFYCLDFFVPAARIIEDKSLLLLRLDGVGDYILFRNFIEVLLTSEYYGGYRITLVGNILWKNLAESFDGQFVENFIWIDKSEFTSSFLYRYHKLKEIASRGYSVVINPVYSRVFFDGDSIVKRVNSPVKIGSEGDLSNINSWLKKIGDRYYTRLIPVTNKIIFEFYRNREFFSDLLDRKVGIHKPALKKDIFLDPGQPRVDGLPEQFALFFIGCGAEFRRWPIGHFAKLGRHLKRECSLDIVICGGTDDIDRSADFLEFFDDDCLNLVGRLSLTEFANILSRADIVVSNETFVPHMAVALDVKNVFVVSNGNHYKRFSPYPDEMTENYHVVYPPQIEENRNNFDYLCNTYGNGSSLNIGDVSVENLIKVIDGEFIED